MKKYKKDNIGRSTQGRAGMKSGKRYKK